MVLVTSAAANAGDVAICSIADRPTGFDHQNITLQGTAVGVKRQPPIAATTTQRSNCKTPAAAVPSTSSLGPGDQVRVDGVFETEHHQGRYTFHTR